MKTARKIEIPEDRRITEDEYLDYRKHAINSSIWYLQNYRSHSSKLIKRLKEKGYIEEDVFVIGKDNNIDEHNIMNECLSALNDASYLNDKAFIEDQMESFSRRGFGYTMAKMKLRQKGIPSDELEGYDDIFNDLDLQLESLDKIYTKAQRSSRYKKLPEFQRQMFVKSKFYERGFDSDAIEEWIEERQPWS